MLKLKCEICSIEKLPEDYYPKSYLICKKCSCARVLARKNGEKVPSRAGERKNRKIDPMMFGPQEPTDRRRKRVREKWANQNNNLINSYYEKKKDIVKQDRVDNPAKYVHIRAKNRAKEKNLPFDLSIEDIVIPTHCPILGVELVPNSAKRSNSISIDRIDPTKGYTKDNIWIISGKANVMKNNASLEELKLFGEWAIKFTEEYLARASVESALVNEEPNAEIIPQQI